MKRELNYITIDGVIGGNQDCLPERDMRGGGCGAVTACEVCLCLAADGTLPESVCPCSCRDITTDGFVEFSRVMKPYLSPRIHGIDLLETYICGFSDYLHDVGVGRVRSSKSPRVTLGGLDGGVPVWRAAHLIRDRINCGVPVPYLMLRHINPKLEDFEWHWFNVTGYDELDNDMLIKVVTYGQAHWLSLRDMWNTGFARRGGLVSVKVMSC